jgi:hypothetical protein
MPRASALGAAQAVYRLLRKQRQDIFGTWMSSNAHAPSRNQKRAFTARRQDMLVILRSDGIGNRAQAIRVRRAKREQVHDLHTAEAPGMRKRHAAS